MILVLNLGLKSMRAIVFDDRGRRLLTASRPVHTFLDGDRVEQDPADWRRLTLEVLAEASANPAIRDALKAITITSSASNLVCTAPDGTALGRAMLVSDTRASTEASELAANPLFTNHAATSGNLHPEPSLTLPRLLWLRHHDPTRWNQSRFFLSSNAWLLAQLTGITVTDPLIAETSGFHTTSNSYPADLLDHLGIPAHKLAPVAPILSTIGPLLPDIAAAAGLANRNIPVILTPCDAICGVFGTTAGQQGIACDLSDTLSSLRTLSPSPPTSPLNGLRSQLIPSTGLHIVSGSHNPASSLIQWVRQSFYHSNPDAHNLIASDAASAGPGADGLVFLPYLLGERAPSRTPPPAGSSSASIAATADAKGSAPSSKAPPAPSHPSAMPSNPSPDPSTKSAPPALPPVSRSSPNSTPISSASQSKSPPNPKPPPSALPSSANSPPVPSPPSPTPPTASPSAKPSSLTAPSLPSTRNSSPSTATSSPPATPSSQAAPPTPLSPPASPRSKGVPPLSPTKAFPEPARWPGTIPALSPQAPSVQAHVARASRPCLPTSPLSSHFSLLTSLPPRNKPLSAKAAAGSGLLLESQLSLARGVRLPALSDLVPSEPAIQTSHFSLLTSKNRAGRLVCLESPQLPHRPTNQHPASLNASQHASGAAAQHPRRAPAP
jgi:sugar (pentulose or hexulose) kinase